MGKEILRSAQDDSTDFGRYSAVWAPTLRVGFDGGWKAVAEQSFLVEFGAFLWTDNYYLTTREMGS